MEQMSFDFGDAREYMTLMLGYDNQRDELSEAINEARTEARERGLPTKAIEAAIRAAKGRRKSALTVAEFTALMAAAETLMGQEETRYE